MSLIHSARCALATLVLSALLMPTREMGYRAAELLSNQLKGKSSDLPESVVVSAQEVIIEKSSLRSCQSDPLLKGALSYIQGEIVIPFNKTKER